MCYWETRPHDCKDKAGEKALAAGSSGKRKREINERVCCDSCSNAAAIITIHQDNE